MENPALRKMLNRRSAPGSDGAREAALFARLPAAKQKLVADRLPVIDTYMSAKDSGTGDPAKAAQDLGLGVRSLLRLVQRTRELGAVAAIAPTPDAGRKRRSDAEKTLSVSADQLIMAKMAKTPTMSIGALVEMVRERDPDASVSTVRRRALMWRRKVDPAGISIFGQAWLLDQAAVRIPVDRGGQISWLVANFLVDESTEIILGCTVTPEGADPVAVTLLDALSRVHFLLNSRLKFATASPRLTWVVPPGMHVAADAVLGRVAGLSPPVEVSILNSGKFRRGSELSKILGGNVGAADILIRATANPAAVLTPNDPPPLTEAAARKVLDDNVAFHNSLVASWARPPGFKRQVSKRRVKELTNVLTPLVDAFEPLLVPKDAMIARELLKRLGGPD